MIKIIIRDFARYKRSLNGWKARFVFFDLNRLDSVDDDPAADRAITQVRLPNGIYKTTRTNRFEDLDSRLIELLEGEELSVHDVGASNGVTSVELLSRLQNKGFRAHLTFSDKFAKIFSLNRWYGSLFIDQSGEVLFADFFGIQAFRNTSWQFAISKLLGFCIPKKLNMPAGKTDVLLVHPRAKTKINSGEIRFEEWDVFADKPVHERFDVVRCMNLLNKEIFTEETILKGLANLRALTRENGILLIGRTDEPTRSNHATFYRCAGGNITAIADLNTGTDMKALVELSGKVSSITA